MKRCTRCGTWKLLSEFVQDKRTQSGKGSWCKKCNVEHVKQWQIKNPDKKREHRRLWRKRYPDKAREQQRRSVARHPRTEKMKIWNQNNHDKSSANQRNRRSRVKGNGGNITAEEWMNLKSKYKFTCLKCGRKEPEIKLALDHVLPIFKGGRNAIDNAQPLCKSCNSSKGTKHIDYR